MTPVSELLRDIAAATERETRALSPNLRRIAAGTRRGLEGQLADARLEEWKAVLPMNKPKENQHGF